MYLGNQHIIWKREKKSEKSNIRSVIKVEYFFLLPFFSFFLPFRSVSVRLQMIASRVFFLFVISFDSTRNSIIKSSLYFA